MDEFDDDSPHDPPFSADADAWFANLLFWRPSKLSDEQMQPHFHHHDGKWSRQTKHAMERFQARGLDLNENWALSRPLWTCPACGRYKSEIFRLNARNILLAKLELHHDHLRDVISKRAVELFGADWHATAPADARLVVDRIRELVTRFSFALICSECNSADAAAKTQLREEVDSRFTFTAEEIGRFVTSKPNAQHSVDIETARAMWNEQKPGFQHRLELTDQLLVSARSGLLTRNHKGLADANAVMSAMDTSGLLSGAFYRETEDSQRAGLLSVFRAEFLARSTSKDSARLVQTGRKPAPVQEPTEEEYRSYVSPTAKRWDATPDDWTCPICARQKRQVLRMSNAKKWSGSIREIRMFTDEQDEDAIANRLMLYPNFSNEKFVGQTATLEACSDCANVAILVGQRDRSLVYPILSPDDIRASITAIAPHTAHEIDYDTAIARARANEPYGPALEAFNSFRARASDFAVRFALLNRRGTEAEAILEEFSEDVRVFHRIDDPAESRRLADWLLEQGRRFHRGSSA